MTMAMMMMILEKRVIVLGIKFPYTSLNGWTLVNRFLEGQKILVPMLIVIGCRFRKLAAYSVYKSQYAYQGKTDKWIDR
jgi:hypothetical protein